MRILQIFRGIWKDNVGGSLIAACIVALVPYLIAFIKSLFDKTTVLSVLNDFVFLLNTLISNKILLIVVVLIIFIALVLGVRMLMRKVEPIIDSVTEKYPPKININSTIFFSHRLSDAFPGDRGIVWYDNPKEVLNRLIILLKEPLLFDSINDEASSQPIWWFRDSSSSSILKFKRLSRTKALMDISELNIHRIAVNIDSFYYKSFVYVECKPDKQTGLYNTSKEDIKKCVADFGYCWEEYGLFKGIKVKREEYDDNSAVLNGKVTSISGSELRVRYLSKFNFIIAAQESPFNSHKFDNDSKEFFDGLLNGVVKPKEFFQFMKTFRKNDE